jgi:Flp pilus assembly protein TadD
MAIFLLFLGLAILFLLLLRHLPEVAEESAQLTKRNLLSTFSGFEKKFESGFVYLKDRIFHKKVAAEKKGIFSKFKLPKLGQNRQKSDFDSLTLAENAFEARQYSLAEKYLIQSIAKNPADPKLYNKLGIIYLEQKNYADAKDAFAEVLKLEPNNAAAWNNYGLAHFNLGNNRAAIEAYEKSLAINSSIASRHVNLGLALLAEKQHAAAEAAFEKAKSLDVANELDCDRLIKEAQKSREKLTKNLGRI